jgi:hypothetical protein
LTRDRFRGSALVRAGTLRELACSGWKRGIAPPDCTCHAGGALVVNFTASGNEPTFNGRYWTYYGLYSDTTVTDLNPVEMPIPDWVSGAADLPFCQPGTQPGPSNACQVQ